MNDNEYLNYADKLIIFDASPIIELHKLGKLEYLSKLLKKENISEIVNSMRSHKFHIPDNATDIIYGKKYSINKGIKI